VRLHLLTYPSAYLCGWCRRRAEKARSLQAAAAVGAHFKVSHYLAASEVLRFPTPRLPYERGGLDQAVHIADETQLPPSDARENRPGGLTKRVPSFDGTIHCSVELREPLGSLGRWADRVSGPKGEDA
jgi:hypothetical protein